MNEISDTKSKNTEENTQMLITIGKYLHLIKLEFLEHLQKYKTFNENVIKKF